MMGTSAMNTLRMEFATLRGTKAAVRPVGADAPGCPRRRLRGRRPAGAGALALPRGPHKARPGGLRGGSGPRPELGDLRGPPRRTPGRQGPQGPTAARSTPAPRRCSRQVRVLDDELDVLVRQLGDAHGRLVGVRHGFPFPPRPPARSVPAKLPRAAPVRPQKQSGPGCGAALLVPGQGEARPVFAPAPPAPHRRRFSPARFPICGAEERGWGVNGSAKACGQPRRLPQRPREQGRPGRPGSGGPVWGRRRGR